MSATSSARHSDGVIKPRVSRGRAFRVALVVFVIAGCGKLPAGDNAGNGLRLVDNERVTADRPFKLRIDLKVFGVRSPSKVAVEFGRVFTSTFKESTEPTGSP